MKVIYAPLIHRDSMVDASPCLVSSVIELPFSQYRLFTENLFADHDFIRDCEEPLHRDSSGVNHCLLVLGEGSDDGILVRSDGQPHAVYAKYGLGKLHLLEDPETYDPAKAIAYLEEAAENDHSYAQYKLGKLLIEGTVVPADLSKGIRWLEASAEQDNPYAQYYLGKLYLY